MFLVLIETSGNQNYIFSTNKLRENIGASELTFRTCANWVVDAIGQLTFTVPRNCRTSAELRDILFNHELNPEITGKDVQFEIILATSGKALVLVKAEANAKALIQNVTLRALKEAPGLEVTGAYQAVSLDTEELGIVNQKLHALHQGVRAQKPSSNLRFLTLPVIEQCATSGLPAKIVSRVSDKPMSAFSDAKEQVHEQGRRRIQQLLLQEDPRQFADDVNDLEATEKINWLAVIHADGNGLGEIFLKFHQHIGATCPAQNRDYINKLRRFSIALDICTETAFLAALPQLRQFENRPNLIPLVPLILGGDDLTVVCEGETALPFTHKFLTVFEEQTARTALEDGIIPELAKAALGVPRLSACAGVAIVKLHFPFSIAYSLAESLMKVAKTVKTHLLHPEKSTPYPCSALDFHILYDSSDVQLSFIRQKLQPLTGEHLYDRPYVVTPMTTLETPPTGAIAPTASAIEWARFHHWQHLVRQVNLLLATDPEEPGRRLLPNTQTHALRQALFQGQVAADASYNLVLQRYPGLEELGSSEPNSLFSAEPMTGQRVTALIDAIDAAAFLPMAQDNPAPATPSESEAREVNA
jgi:hypothetical protein